MTRQRNISPMCEFTLEEMKLKLFPRRYFLLEREGVKRMYCSIQDEYTQDATCNSINEMLEQGLVCEETVLGWISIQCFNQH